MYGKETLDIDKIETQLTEGTADPYWQAWLVWLEGKPDNMRRSYYRAKQMEFLEGKHFRHITPLDVAAGRSS
jgi:hypothetical protein